MSGGYENRAAEVGAVRELVQEFRELALRRRETHVDHVEALLDRPAQAAEEHRAAALETGAEHADAVEAHFRCEGADDPGAGRAVAAEVSFRVLVHLEPSVLGLHDGHRALELADKRMAALDAAVEDADADALARRVAERPVAGDPFGPLDADRDPLRGAGREAPGGKAGIAEVLHRANLRATALEDAAAEFVEQGPSRRLDALRPQRVFEIGDEGPTELGVRFGALDDSVQLPAGSRQLPCRARPGGRSRGEHSDQAGKPFNVVSAHHVTCSQDAGPGSFLPSNAWRSLSRHREMRLAIVPAGSSRASPIAR